MNDFQRCLEELDVPGARLLWYKTHSHLPQPDTDEDVLIMLHRARTEAKSVPENMRLYSHHWLVDRMIPSGLPDELKPKAERLYPKIVSAVGIAIMNSSPYTKDLAKAMEEAMSLAVLEAYADGNEDPVFVKARMEEAKLKVINGS